MAPFADSIMVLWTILLCFFAVSTSSRTQDRRITGECRRLAEDRRDSDKCHIFKRCCSERCRERGVRPKERVCHDFDSEAICRCSEARRREEWDESSDSLEGDERGSRRREGRGRELERINIYCQQSAMEKARSHHQRCQKFRHCCRKKCEYNELLEYRNRDVRCHSHDMERASCECRVSRYNE